MRRHGGALQPLSIYCLPSETIQWTLIHHFALHTTTMHGNHYTPHTTHATMVEEHNILPSEGGRLKSSVPLPHKRFWGGEKVLCPMNSPLAYCRYSTKNIWEKKTKLERFWAKAISYTVGFVSRKGPFSTETQIELSYTVEKGLFRLNFFRLTFPTGGSSRET